MIRINCGVRRIGESPALDDRKAPQGGIELFSGGLPATGFQQGHHVPGSDFRIGSQARCSGQPIDGRGSVAARQQQPTAEKSNFRLCRRKPGGAIGMAISAAKIARPNRAHDLAKEATKMGFRLRDEFFSQRRQ